MLIFHTIRKADIFDGIFLTYGWSDNAGGGSEKVCLTPEGGGPTPEMGGWGWMREREKEIENGSMGFFLFERCN